MTAAVKRMKRSAPDSLAERFTLSDPSLHSLNLNEKKKKKLVGLQRGVRSKVVLTDNFYPSKSVPCLIIVFSVLMCVYSDVVTGKNKSLLN